MALSLTTSTPSTLRRCWSKVYSESSAPKENDPPPMIARLETRSSLRPPKGGLVRRRRRPANAVDTMSSESVSLGMFQSQS